MTLVAADLILARRRVAGCDIYYRPGTSDEQVIEDVFVHQYHVPPAGSQAPRSILDLGANIGLTMLHYRLVWPDAQIFGVEMDAENVAIAYRNTDDPVLCAAVGVGNFGLYVSDGEPWAYSVADIGDRVTAGVTLDAICPGPIDLLKLDIEGAEEQVLGAADLSRFRAVIVELHGDYDKPDAVRDLRGQGFDVNPALRHDRAVYAWRQ